MWERGLKHVASWTSRNQAQSLPMWERGLKPSKSDRLPLTSAVAPHVGAWIETKPYLPRHGQSDVAPHVGAWIETSPIR